MEFFQHATNRKYIVIAGIKSLHFCAQWELIEHLCCIIAIGGKGSVHGSTMGAVKYKQIFWAQNLLSK